MKPGFNEADRYLIERWAQAYEFERGMAAVRRKYEGILESALAELRKRRWWERDFKGWASENYGIGFARKSWDVTNHPHHFPGLWMDQIELNCLLTDAAEQPKAYLWIGPLKEAGHDLRTVKKTILKHAATVLKRFPQRSSENEIDIICYTIPEGRKEVERALSRDGSKPFIDLLCRHADRLAGLIPAFDEAMRRKSRK